MLMISISASPTSKQANRTPSSSTTSSIRLDKERRSTLHPAMSTLVMQSSFQDTKTTLNLTLSLSKKKMGLTDRFGYLINGSANASAQDEKMENFHQGVANIICATIIKVLDLRASPLRKAIKKRFHFSRSMCSENFNASAIANHMINGLPSSAV